MFVKINDCTVINTDHILWYDTGEQAVCLTDGDVRHIDEKYKNHFQLKIHELNYKDAAR